MAPLRPRTHLQSHDVINQPPPFEDINLFTSDQALQEAIAAAGGKIHFARLVDFGRTAGSAEVAELAMQANRYRPQLKVFDRYGQRLDEVEFHPAYHGLMRLGLEAGIASVAWSGVTAGHVLHAALEFLMAQAEPGVCCPMTMTYAAQAMLKREPEIAQVWSPKILSSRYDPASRPISEKIAGTIGMAMTEKQGGSDLRANMTKAVPTSQGIYNLVGHKWFCSAPMSDAFFTLASSQQGLSCFFVSRWTENGERNAINLVRLKDKLGDRSNASAEIEYHGADARLVGETGHGVRAIMEMVHHTRLDCVVTAAAYIRQAVANALWHTAHRTAYQKRLIDQPLMRAVLADMVLESEAATALCFRVARSFDEGFRDNSAAQFARIGTPIAKYWVNKRVTNLVFEAMEAHGGSGYVEESIIPRLFRQSPLNSIWEGAGNVICLDVLRALERNPETKETLIAELEHVRGVNNRLDILIDSIKEAFVEPVNQEKGRRLVEQLALALQSATLIKTAPAVIADSFCASRLGSDPGFGYGAFNGTIDCEAILSRAMT